MLILWPPPYGGAAIIRIKYLYNPSQKGYTGRQKKSIALVIEGAGKCGSVVIRQDHQPFYILVSELPGARIIIDVQTVAGVFVFAGGKAPHKADACQFCRIFRVGDKNYIRGRIGVAAFSVSCLL